MPFVRMISWLGPPPPGELHDEDDQIKLVRWANFCKIGDPSKVGIDQPQHWVKVSDKDVIRMKIVPGGHLTEK